MFLIQNFKKTIVAFGRHNVASILYLDQGWNDHLKKQKIVPIFESLRSQLVISNKILKLVTFVGFFFYGMILDLYKYD